jgi:hypothetical protein
MHFCMHSKSQYRAKAIQRMSGLFPEMLPDTILYCSRAIGGMGYEGTQEIRINRPVG